MSTTSIRFEKHEKSDKLEKRSTLKPASIHKKKSLTSK